MTPEGRNSEAIARQRLGKQVSAATHTQETIEELFGTMFCIRSVQRGYKEGSSLKSAAEFRSSKWAVSRELSSARKAEKMALGAQLAIGLWREVFACAVVQCVIQWDGYSTCIKIRCQETASGEFNRLRTIVCNSEL
jgi:hypothetical protein